jgi:hypothetical protein
MIVLPPPATSVKPDPPELPRRKPSIIARPLRNRTTRVVLSAAKGMRQLPNRPAQAASLLALSDSFGAGSKRREFFSLQKVRFKPHTALSTAAHVDSLLWVAVSVDRKERIEHGATSMRLCRNSFFGPFCHPAIS